MQKIKIQRTNRETNEVDEVEIYDSTSPKRLEGETREEYLTRRDFINQLEKKRKRTKNFVHVSSTLIPLMSKDGKILIGPNGPMWIGKTKGKTYIKTEENEK